MSYLLLHNDAVSMNQHHIFCRFRNEEGTSSDEGPEDWAPLKPHGLYPVVWTTYKEDCSIKYAFFQPDWPWHHLKLLPPLRGIPAAMRRSGGVCDEPQNVSLFKPAGRGLKREEAESFLGGSRDLRRDDSWHMRPSPAAVGGLGLSWRLVLILHREHLSAGPEGEQRAAWPWELG